eukprot:2051378-Amphidinium_carterae.1
MQVTRGHNPAVFIVPLSAYYLHTRTRLLGHLLRLSPDDALYQCTCNEKSDDILSTVPCRDGRPKIQWLHSILTHAQTLIEPDTPSAPHLLPTLFELAQQRHAPFA